MSFVNFQKAIVVITLLCVDFSADAVMTSPETAKPMKMEEPMPTNMAKPGTKKGDVKKAATKKEREMKPMMDKESSPAEKK